MRMKRIVILTLILMACFSTGCASVLRIHRIVNAALPTPTINPYFSNRVETPTSPALPSPSPTPTYVILTPTPEARVVTKMIYDEALADGWSTQDSQGGQVDPLSTRFAYAGTNSIAFTPEKDFGNLFLTVKAFSPQQYDRSRVIGFSFWVYCDTDYILTSDLLVTITGSNQAPYWKLGDTSVTNRYEPIFSATRLYFLGFNHDIPPKTWTQVDVVLDDLIYDPSYQFVTGLMIKNDEGFRNTIYIDQVQVNLLESITHAPTSTEATATTSSTFDATPTP